jgi:hypothetical protein
LPAGLFREADEFLEHELAGGLGEFVDVGGGEVFGFDGGQN